VGYGGAVVCGGKEHNDKQNDKQMTNTSRQIQYSRLVISFHFPPYCTSRLFPHKIISSFFFTRYGLLWRQRPCLLTNPSVTVYNAMREGGKRYACSKERSKRRQLLGQGTRCVRDREKTCSKERSKWRRHKCCTIQM